MALSLRILLQKKTAMKDDKLAGFLVTERENSNETQNYGVFETRQATPREKKKQKPPSYFILCLYAPINYTAIFSKPPNAKISRNVRISASVIVFVK